MSALRNKISRRDAIKQFGLAAGLALPFLNSEVAMGQTTTAPVRVLFVALQHGWGMSNEVNKVITGTETNFTLPSPINVFNSIKNQCVFVDGLRTSFWGNAHDVAYSDMLTCGVRYNEPSASALGGPFPLPRNASLDWMIGNQFNKNVLRLSHNYQSWGANYHPLSFDNNIRNLPFFTNARDAYMSVIDPLKQQQLPNAVASTTNNALLNYLNKDAKKLLTRLGPAEKSKMEGYLASLISLGTRILNPATGVNLNNITLPNLPGLTLSFNDQLDQYLEMIKVAFTLDTHRVAVLGLGEGVMDWTWKDSANATRVGNIFGSDFHHEIAHYSEAANPNSRPAFEGWISWYAQKIVNLVNALSIIDDVDGRKLIDNTIIVLTGEVADGQHDHSNMLHTVIGGGGNKINRGRWLKSPTVDPRNRQGVILGALDPSGNQIINEINYGPPISRHHAADLWVSVARLAGLNIDSFGQSIYNYQPIQL